MFTRAEAKLLRQAELRGVRSGASVAGKRHASAARAKAGAAALRQQIILAKRASNYNIPIPANRLMEHKTYDATAGIVSVANCFNTNGVVAPTPFVMVAATSAWALNQVPLGNSSVTRVGRRFQNTAIALRGQIYAASATVESVCTMVLVWDRHPNQNAAIPAFATVFTQQHSGSLTNKDNASRFKVLRRWTYEIIGNATTAGQQTDKTVVYFDEFVKMKNKVTLLTAADTTGLITDMVEGALYLYVMGDAALGATTSPGMQMQTRLYFSDH